jgi:hypothetical protein
MSAVLTITDEPALFMESCPAVDGVTFCAFEENTPAILNKKKPALICLFIYLPGLRLPINFSL